MRRRDLIALAGGTSIAWPLVARAQERGKSYRLAILTQANPVDQTTGKRDRSWTAFFDELRRLGYDEGRNLAVAWYSSEGDAGRVAQVARQVVGLKPDVIFSPDARMAGVLKAATSTIPVVAITIDPVGTGLAISLARPGGNITGFSVEAGLEIFGKRFDLLKQAVPAVSRVGWLTPRRVVDLPFVGTLREAARVAGLTLVDAVLEPPVDAAEYRRVFAIMARDGVDSLWVASALENLAHRRLIAELAIGSKLPGMYLYRENVEAGGLMSYGHDAPDTFRRSAGYVDRVLKGARPADMPFQQPIKFELVINLGTAKTLGLTIPPALLARADEVIE